MRQLHDHDPDLLAAISAIAEINTQWQMVRDLLNRFLNFDEQHPRDPATGRFVDHHVSLLALVRLVTAGIPEGSIPVPWPPKTDDTWVE